MNHHFGLQNHADNPARNVILVNFKMADVVKIPESITGITSHQERNVGKLPNYHFLSIIYRHMGQYVVRKKSAKSEHY